MTILEAITYFKNILTLKNMNQTFEVRLLIQHYCWLTATEYITKSHCYVLSNTEIQLISNAINKRNTGYPLAYILGYKDFWQHRFIVNDAVLIPRPETELLIEQALLLFPNQSSAINILDIGTGSGCILLSLLKEYINSFGVGVDISKPALKVADNNAKHLSVPNSQFVLLNQNLLTSLATCNFFNLIVSNPPYISTSDTMLEENVKKYEPNNALFASNNGLFFYEQILGQAKLHLTKNGYILLEVGYNQAEAVINIGLKYKLCVCKTVLDYKQIPRVVIFSNC